LVGFEALDADLLEAGEEFAVTADVGDRVLAFGGLVFFEVCADGFVLTLRVHASRGSGGRVGRLGRRSRGVRSG